MYIEKNIQGGNIQGGGESVIFVVSYLGNYLIVEVKI